MRNVVAIAGIETVRDASGKVLKLSVTFLNNIDTWHKNNPKDKLKIIDARDYLTFEYPMQALWSAIRQAHDKIDLLIYSGHSDPEGLYIYSHIRRELEELDRYVNFDTDWSSIQFNEKAEIVLWGCRTGGSDGKKYKTCIAQDIADKTGVAVWGYLCKSSQKKRKSGYYQVPDTGVLTKFERGMIIID